MSTQNKKLLCTVITVVLLLALLPGCGIKAKDARAPVVVLGAMECEYSTLAAALENPEVTSYGGYEFTRGTLDGYPVIAVRCLIGMVNSAAATTLAVDNFSPYCVIMQGTAGGHSLELHQGDIVLGESVAELGSYYSPHRDEGEGSDFTQWTYPGVELPVDGEIQYLQILHSDEPLMEIAESVSYDGGSLVRGTIGSADAWNKEIDKINFCHEVLGSDCEEMETFAVAQVCRQLNVPFLGIRIISNSELYPEEAFSEQFGIDCQNYTLDVIRALIARMD